MLGGESIGRVTVRHALLSGAVAELLAAVCGVWFAEDRWRPPLRPNLV